MSIQKILCIDGVDGCGKGTITSMIKDRLESEGHKVAVISPPFYHSRSGQIVKSYLTHGYGDITDRRIAAQMYSFDRNMWYMKHFAEIFDANGTDFDIVIYDRNWLSNLFFQTSLICQDPADTTRLESTNIYVRLYMTHPPIGYPLAVMHDMITAGKEEPILDKENLRFLYGKDVPDFSKFTYAAQRKVSKAYTDARIKKLREMINFIYLSEIDPWKVLTKDAKMTTFTSTADISTIVLTPGQSARYSHIIDENLNKRYEGDESKKDRNEQSSAFLLSVNENIHWIKKNYTHIVNGFFPEDINHAFKYEIIETTDPNSDGQLPIETVAEKAYQTLMRNDNPALIRPFKYIEDEA